ncbi:hypothetical protein L2BCAN2_00374 [Chlamydia trachomatis L2b/Canada2]|nr:hypothetical protein L2B795_00374 [Chlamydia trachomatis L2b/795]CCP68623.1 hypothetical protein L2BCAN2_00374 [Chlamydia trachomatis L2b/Canada2]CCP90459.1 hypothetical protein L2BAMS2_00373 [Chlamydia trachomatis L2b/Ams2]CCP91349.1 hypothetical protein L2BAMS3_00373 [Chlamydia trachomatis L2b/Ams3]CCP93135.1 hypothetical protein L2BAMS4_00374 [Chlamydia trachomatis L2b/Ams4]
MTFISAVESANSQLELERKKEQRVIEILKEICKEIGVYESLFDKVTDSLEFCELLKKILAEKDSEDFLEDVSTQDSLSSNEQPISEQTIGDRVEESAMISECMIKDVLNALQQCTESFQRKEEEASFLERKDLELRERELAFKEERLSWEREKAEKEWAWKKEQYIRDLVKREQK